MKKVLSVPNIYILLWALYYTQGTFISRGSYVSRLVLLAFLMISFFYAFVTYTKYFQVSPYFKSLGLLLIMFTVYGTLGMVSGVGFDYLKMIYLSLLPTFPFFVWTQRGMITPKWIRTVFFVMCAVVGIQYYATYSYIEETFFDAENATVNIAYEVLALIPLLLFWKNKPVIQYIMLAIVMATVLSTVKRGAIIIGVICSLYFFISTVQASSKRVKWLIWLLILFFVVLGVRYALNFYSNSSYAQYRMASTLAGDSSGRGSIYSQAWSTFVNSEHLSNILFGYGASSTIKLLGIAAHNDWLELLVNQGLLGVSLYLVYWITLLLIFRESKNSAVHSVLGQLLIIYFIATLFSMSYSAMTLPANLALGYCLSMLSRNPSKQDFELPQHNIKAEM